MQSEVSHPNIHPALARGDPRAAVWSRGATRAAPTPYRSAVKLTRTAFRRVQIAQLNLHNAGDANFEI
jgi:hypothetical protein